MSLGGSIDLTVFNDFYVSTLKNMLKGNKLTDQIFDPKKSALFDSLMKAGSIKQMSMSSEGGTYISFFSEKDSNDNLQWLSENSTVAYNSYDFMEEVRYEWKYAAATMSIPWQDLQKNSGRSQIINYTSALTRNTLRAARENLDAVLFGSANNSSNQMHGLQHLIADDNDANVAVGSINPSTATWWRNYALDFTATYGSTDSDWTNNYSSAIRTMENSLIPMAETGNMIFITSQHIYELMAEDIGTYLQMTPNTMNDLGAATRLKQYDGIPIMWSKNVGNRMYLLNLDHIHFVYDPRYLFTPGTWRPVENQPNSIKNEFSLCGNFVVDSRRAHGVLYNLPTP